MDDNKRQESKKTVVAFASGLIIGGLLVWAFADAPNASAPDDKLDDEKADSAMEKKSDVVMMEKTDDAPMMEASMESNFAFSVANQPKGMVVSLGDNVKYPTKEGWIVVHDEVNGKLGNAMGASRYNTEVGLTPNSVELLRGTEAGKTYHVVYYTESGDRVFNRTDDVPLTKEGGGMVEATFVAE